MGELMKPEDTALSPQTVEVVSVVVRDIMAPLMERPAYVGRVVCGCNELFMQSQWDGSAGARPRNAAHPTRGFAALEGT